MSQISILCSSLLELQTKQILHSLQNQSYLLTYCDLVSQLVHSDRTYDLLTQRWIIALGMEVSVTVLALEKVFWISSASGTVVSIKLYRGG